MNNAISMLDRASSVQKALSAQSLLRLQALPRHALGGAGVVNGILGYNVRTLGVGRDNIIAAARALGGKYLLAHDDPELAAVAAANGFSVIYRQTEDGALQQDPAAFVAERAKNAPAATFIHLTNELDPTPELLAWTTEAMKYADSIKRRLCLYNFATHRSTSQWADCAAQIRTAVSGGHSVGLHIYTEQAGDSGAHQYADLKRNVGGLWLITEFGFARDAYNGWRGALSEQAYVNFCRAWLPTFAAEGMPALLFSYDHWTANEYGKAHGFGVNDAPSLLNGLAALNVQFPIKEAPTVPTVNEPADPGAAIPATVVQSGVRLRADASLTAPVLRTLSLREKVTLFDGKSAAVTVDKYPFRFAHDANGQPGWAAAGSQTGDVWIQADAAAPVPTFRIKNPVCCASVISSKFGVPRDYNGDGVFEAIHEGLDITRFHADCTPPIRAGVDGVVSEVSSVGDYGNHVKVKVMVGAQAYVIWLCHLEKILVTQGQTVKPNDYVGIMGTTGNSTGLHVHLNVQKVGAPTPAGSPVPSVIDPEPLIQW